MKTTPSVTSGCRRIGQPPSIEPLQRAGRERPTKSRGDAGHQHGSADDHRELTRNRSSMRSVADESQDDCKDEQTQQLIDGHRSKKKQTEIRLHDLQIEHQARNDRDRRDGNGRTHEQRKREPRYCRRAQL